MSKQIVGSLFLAGLATLVAAEPLFAGACLCVKRNMKTR